MRGQSNLPFLHRWDPSRYAPAYLRAGPPEKMVQQAILDALPYLGVFAFPIDAGAKALRGRAYGALKAANLGTSALAGRTGAAAKGVCDIIGVRRDGRAVLIEVKKPAMLDPYGKVLDPAGKPTKEQLDFLLTGHLHNAIVGVAWSTNDAGVILGVAKDGGGYGVS